MRISDWSSDVCSSDLIRQVERPKLALVEPAQDMQRRAHRAAVGDDEGGNRRQLVNRRRHACDQVRPAFAAGRRKGVALAPEAAERLAIDVARRLAAPIAPLQHAPPPRSDASRSGKEYRRSWGS